LGDPDLPYRTWKKEPGLEVVQVPTVTKPKEIRRGDRRFNSKQRDAAKDRPIASSFEPPSLDTNIFPTWLALSREGMRGNGDPGDC
jgi:hypothetical protein